MRKVKFKKWIPQEYQDSQKNIRIANTGCFQSDYETDGIFHQWGCAYEEFESGPGNFTIAIIETLDGEIHEVLPCKMKFIDLS